MDLQIVSKFKDSLEEVDSIFSTSLVLKDLYYNSLDNIIKKKALTYTQKNALNNILTAIINTEKESIEEAEKEAFKRLYVQGFLLTLSIAEQFLKDVFDNLLFQNLEKIEKIDEKEFKFRFAREKKFELTRDDWVEFIKISIYGETNPSEKINFQNIKSIQGIFESYFKIKLIIDERLEKQIHFFYQCRHILIHNGGIIDKKFLINLEKAKFTHEHKINKKLIIDEENYEECKKAFIEIFSLIELTIKNSR